METATIKKRYLDSFKRDFPLPSGDWEGTLSQRKEKYRQFFARRYGKFRKEFADHVLSPESAWDILTMHTAWVDAWVCFTLEFVFEEKDWLIREFLDFAAQQISYLASSIVQNQKRITELQGYLFDASGAPVPMDPAEHSYYRKSMEEARCKVLKMEAEFETLKEVEPSITDYQITREQLEQVFVIFARGGYGRTELSFSSDIDLGYCVDPQRASKIDVQIAQELIKRIQELFQELPLDIASQYFELGEDLSRFANPDMMHTIPSIIEARPIVGASEILPPLKAQLIQVCNEETILRFFQEQILSLKPERSNDQFFIKEGYGGIRHLNFALWMVQIVYQQEVGNSRSLLQYLADEGVITDYDRQNATLAMEFYHDLRNFLGLYDLFQPNLNEIQSHDLMVRPEKKSDYLDDHSCMAYLRLKSRFTTVDSMDRFRLASIRSISRITKEIVSVVLDRTTTEKLETFVVVKHLESNQIIQFLEIEAHNKSSWNLQFSAQFKAKPKDLLAADEGTPFFLEISRIFELFCYVARTGNELSVPVKNRLSTLIPRLAKQDLKQRKQECREFLYQLFTAKQTSVAVSQMMDIAIPMTREGGMQTLLGILLPKVNEMRFLLRNLNIHQYPLCEHSIKTLDRVEIEMRKSQKEDPELWRFISDEDVFALKWSAFFHDVGKVNPYRDHEKYGAVVASNMLLDWGWEENAETLILVRLLVRHHQSVVKYSRLSTFLDIGILKFFELANRSPRLVILLYLVNLSDFLSVSEAMERKVAPIQKFFARTLSILAEFRSERLRGSITNLVNDYLNSKVHETRTAVLLDLLLRQCCDRSFEKVVLAMLESVGASELQSILPYQSELEKLIHFLKLAELNQETLEKYRIRFKQITRQCLSEDTLTTLVGAFRQNWDWFFTAFPNRLLLSSTSDTLTTQLLNFREYRTKKVCFSLVKGGPGEYDTLLFYCRGDLRDQTKIAYALGRLGMNIEDGKINRVLYAGDEEGVVGFFRISYGQTEQRQTESLPSETELENMVLSLHIPPLKFPDDEGEERTVDAFRLELLTYKEAEKGYLVVEKEDEAYSRVQEEFTAVQISLLDHSFCYFKLMRAFEEMEVIPQQVTITTIGNQIVDYFYVPIDQGEIVRSEEFKQNLIKHLGAEFSIA